MFSMFFHSFFILFQKYIHFSIRTVFWRLFLSIFLSFFSRALTLSDCFEATVILSRMLIVVIILSDLLKTVCFQVADAAAWMVEYFQILTLFTFERPKNAIDICAVDVVVEWLKKS